MRIAVLAILRVIVAVYFAYFVRVLSCIEIPVGHVMYLITAAFWSCEQFHNVRA